MGTGSGIARPSPAVVVAAVALVAALAGTAVAGPDAGTSALSKKKAKKIAKKQIKKLAPGLSVAEAVSADQAANAAALGGQPPSAFERAGRITTGIVSSDSPVGTRVLRDPRTGADVRMASADGTVQIINTSPSRRMKVAGVSTPDAVDVVDREFVDLAPGGNHTFLGEPFGPEYLDLAITVGGPTGPTTRYTHLTCSAANGSGGFPSILSCLAVG